MPRIKIQRVGRGQHPSEAVVAVKTSDGNLEHLVVDSRSLSNDTLEVGYPVGVGHEGDRLLIELPRETLSGLWRVWIPSDAIVNEEAVA